MDRTVSYSFMVGTTEISLQVIHPSRQWIAAPESDAICYAHLQHTALI